LGEIEGRAKQQLAELDARKESELNRVTEAGKYLDEMLSSFIDQAAPEDLAFEPTGTVLVKADAMVRFDHQTELRRLLEEEPLAAIR